MCITLKDTLHAYAACTYIKNISSYSVIAQAFVSLLQLMNGFFIDKCNIKYPIAVASAIAVYALSIQNLLVHASIIISITRAGI